MFTCDVTKARSFARNFVSVNYRLFSHVSYRLNGKNDNVVLGSKFNHTFSCIGFIVSL